VRRVERERRGKSAGAAGKGDSGAILGGGASEDANAYGENAPEIASGEISSTGVGGVRSGNESGRVRVREIIVRRAREIIELFLAVAPTKMPVPMVRGSL
jgi:hypothetical protein